jgi:hypothetical protein
LLALETGVEMGEAAGRMLWPALKGDHDLTAMAVMRAEHESGGKGNCKAIIYSLLAPTLDPWLSPAVLLE